MGRPQALIIDDNLGNLRVLVELLQLEDIRFIEVYDPRTLEAQLQDMPPIDIIFLDLEMPSLNGYQILRLFKSHPRYSDVPIVACTVHIGEIHTAREQGFHSFIGKPINVDTFPEQLRRILSGEQVWSS